MSGSTIKWCFVCVLCKTDEHEIDLEAQIASPTRETHFKDVGVRDAPRPDRIDEIEVIEKECANKLEVQSRFASNIDDVDRPLPLLDGNKVVDECRIQGSVHLPA